MPPATPTTPTRLTESMLGMSPGEVRLLLFAHLSFDKDSGKINMEKLARRASITVPSAKTMYRGALQKLAKLNPEADTGEGDEASPSTGGASPSTTPSRRAGRRAGRPRKKKGSDAATTTEATPTEAQSTEPKNTEDKAKVDEPEVDRRDGNEETTVAEDEV